MITLEIRYWRLEITNLQYLISNIQINQMDNLPLCHSVNSYFQEVFYGLPFFYG